jgi:hypothetical protein
MVFNKKTNNTFYKVQIYKKTMQIFWSKKSRIRNRPGRKISDSTGSGSKALVINHKSDYCVLRLRY